MGFDTVTACFTAAVAGTVDLDLVADWAFLLGFGIFVNVVLDVRFQLLVNIWPMASHACRFSEWAANIRICSVLLANPNGLAKGWHW